LHKDFQIVSGHQIEENQLFEFYKIVYPDRYEFVCRHWNWLYRCEKISVAPLILHQSGRVIGHAGLIPFELQIRNILYSASWFVDFSLLPEYQRMGLGSRLVEQWYQNSEIHTTFCNKKSLNLFLKMGWQKNQDFVLHFTLLRPFNYPKYSKKIPFVIRFLMNNMSLLLNLSSFIKPKSLYTLLKLDSHNLTKFLELNKKSIQNNITPARNLEFTKWRIENSPNREKYYIYKCNEFQAIVLLNNNFGTYIDILLVSDSSDSKSIGIMIKNLKHYSIKNNFDYIRKLSTYQEANAEVQNSIMSYKKKLNFAFHSFDKKLQSSLNNVNWHFELIDSDFERFV
jgi:GNAT superfamily N-acetyltransferase